jgi:type II secretory pathway pseudopilin PulG
MVIMIIGVLGVILTPQFNSLISEGKLNGAAEQLINGLEYAQNLAITHQRPFGLKAEVEGNMFRVFDNQYKADPNPHHGSDPPVDAFGVVLNPLDKKWFERDFDTMNEFNGVTIKATPAGEEIYFYPDGHSNSVDSTYVLGYGKQQRSITVDGMTGQIAVQ